MPKTTVARTVAKLQADKALKGCILNPDAVRKWATVLRSRKYTQCQSRMATPNKPITSPPFEVSPSSCTFCCLGVLSHLTDPSIFAPEQYTDCDYRLTYGKVSTCLTSTLRGDAADIISEYLAATLATLNDSGHSFTYISKLLLAMLEDPYFIKD